MIAEKVGKGQITLDVSQTQINPRTNKSISTHNSV